MDANCRIDIPELSVIVPTLDEAPNIVVLLPRIAAALAGERWELIVVDDASKDGTAAAVRALAREWPNIRCLERHDERGLASACLAGMALAQGRYFAVIDADLQHDERLLPVMLQRLREGDHDLAVGSRYVEGGAVGAWNALRHGLSRGATAFARRLLAPGLHDPMSGFFIVRAECLRAARPRLSGLGFKLLLDLVTASPQPLRTIELPYRFGCRQAGRSKLDAGVAADFARQLLRDERLRTALAFGLVGSLGAGVHLAIVAAMQAWSDTPFALAQTAAVLTAMACNFGLNNRFTFAARRLRGPAAVEGWLTFMALCSAGAVANVFVASAVHAFRPGGLWAPLAGIAVGAAWNFGTSVTLVWPRAEMPERLARATRERGA